MSKKLRVLVACEYSGRVRDAFIARGHEVMSCDLDPTDVPGPHYHGDVFDVINDGWDMMVAHPPCTYLANSSAAWLYTGELDVWGEKTKNKERWHNLEAGANFFRKLWKSDIPKICCENPIMLGYAKKIIGASQAQIIQPWMFGHPEKKATCLWLKNLPKLVETDNVRVEMEKLPIGQQQKSHWESPSVNRGKIRSLTLQGVADAMSEQWG